VAWSLAVLGRSLAGGGVSATSNSEANNGELPYEEHGQGGPTLLVTGSGFGPKSWGELGNLLAARRRVISYDRRGFTPAAPEPAEHMRVNAYDAESVLRRAEALPADVVGWSGGGLVALALAVEHPSACRSLLLLEPSVHGLRAVTLSALVMTLRATAVKLARNQRAATDVTYRWTFAYRGEDRNAWEEMPSEWREGVLGYAEAVAAEQGQETTLRYPPSRSLRNLDIPVTIALGELGQGYFRRIARHLERLLPNSRLHVVPRASHAVHLDAPAEVAGLVP
jgi:pimeloyl-ACP methyl ester carboxylesterase